MDKKCGTFDIIEYYSAIYKNKNIKFTGKWMELEKKSSQVRQLRLPKMNIVSFHLYLILAFKPLIGMLASK